MPPRTRQRRFPAVVAMYPDRDLPTAKPGLSQPKCAALLGISIRAVQDREYRALAKLRAAIMADDRLCRELALEIP